MSDGYRVVRVEDGAPCLAVQHKDAPDVLGLGKTSFEKYVVPEVRCVRLGSMRLYPVRELERWLDENAEKGAGGMTSSTASGTLFGMASSTQEKVRENRLRRMAERQGLRLVKSRRRDPRAIDYGLYTLVSDRTNLAVAGTERTTGRPEFTLDDVEAWLTGEAE